MKLLLVFLLISLIAPIPWRKFFRAIGIGLLWLLYAILAYGPWLFLGYVVSHFLDKYW